MYRSQNGKKKSFILCCTHIHTSTHKNNLSGHACTHADKHTNLRTKHSKCMSHSNSQNKQTKEKHTWRRQCCDSNLSADCKMVHGTYVKYNINDTSVQCVRRDPPPVSMPQWMLTSAPLSLRFALSCTPNTTLVPSPRLSAIFE